MTFNDNDGKRVSVCQGFWVSAASNGSVDFTNAMRTHDASTPLRSSSRSQSDPVLYLSLNDSSFSDPARIYLSHSALDGVDQKYDAPKMSNSNGINFYTIIDTAQYVFQSVTPPGFTESKLIKLGIRTDSASSFNIKADSFANAGGYEFLLIDNEQETTTKLKQGTKITIELNAPGTFDDRFEILIRKSIVEYDDQAAHEQIEHPEFITSTGGVQVHNITSKMIDQLYVFDLSGRHINTLQNIERQSLQSVSGLKKGIYILRYTYKDNEAPKSEKVFVK